MQYPHFKVFLEVGISWRTGTFYGVPGHLTGTCYDDMIYNDYLYLSALREAQLSLFSWTIHLFILAEVERHINANSQVTTMLNTQGKTKEEKLGCYVDVALKGHKQNAKRNVL